MSHAPAGLALALFLATPAWADLVTLKNGNVLEGETETTPDGVWVKRPRGSVLVHHRDVLRIERKPTPWQVFAERLVALHPGDFPAALDLAFFALDSARPADLEQVVDKALDVARLPDADAALIQFGMLCVERGFKAAARRLLLHAIAAHPDSPTIALGLQRLDFHRVEGRWEPPELYYPGRGFVRFEGRWALPAEVAVIQAQRRLVAAQAAARDAQTNLDMAQRVVNRTLETIADAEQEQLRLAAEVEAAREVLRAQAQDLDHAEQRLLAARVALQGWAPAPCCDEPEEARRAQRLARERREQLEDDVRCAERTAKQTRQRRDRALCALEETLAEQARAPARVAEAKSELAGQQATVTRCEAQRTQAQLALQAAQAAALEARRALVEAQQQQQPAPR